ncbi:hypothetical protein [Massilia sp. BSC265]|uniref:hypothetical protein n=1 Tax=Massilia sp. BSC265 TaxID=1549812 RepID=UPI0004E8C649|nr:hypothetical protein [Massilia sp. BSC265]KFI07114.1 hypothetical protein JN27_11210 [Massilia sp. BSC265]
MRRILVIFLILLFPLNVMALSMSVSMAQQDGASAHAGVASGDAFQGDTHPDIDPDEPPAAELHDLMYQDGCLQLAVLAAAVVAPHAAAPYCFSLPPPDKPPRLA